MENFEVDKISFQALKTLYHGALSQAEFCTIVGRMDYNKPNEIESFLLREKLISVHVSGVPDGAGGFIDETVSRTYSITRRGRFVVEALKGKSIDKWIDRVLNLIP